MQATSILQNEHRVIEQVITCLEKIAAQATAKGKLDGPPAEQALDFFQTFADRCHHGKEENCLFPMMEARGFPRDGGPTGVMLYEHNLGRGFIRGMVEAIPQAAAGASPALKQFADNAQAYIQLMREHIWKENNRLFPMANQFLSPDDQKKLLHDFAHVEHHDMKEGTHEKYLQIASDLAVRYEVPLAPVDQAQPHACSPCGHGRG